MDALEFLKERKRMCISHEHCDGCPLEKDICNFGPSTPDEDCERIIAAVEQWSKEHPRKTRQSEFLKQWPNAAISDDGLPEVAPCQLCVGLIHGASTADCESRSLCVACRCKFWLQRLE